MKYFKSLLTIALLFVSVASFGSDSDSDANSFWNKFRQAVLSKNYPLIASMTRFPFEVRGPDDGNPVKYFERNVFPRIFQNVASQQLIVLSNGKFLGKTMSQIINEKTQINRKDYVTPSFISIEAFEFRLFDSHWFFTRSYLEE